MSKTASRRAGFTLIEVLVALAIIALLVAAVFPTLTRQIEDAEPTRLANDLANIRAGLETFTVNVREVPSDLEDLAVLITANTDLLVDSTAFLDKHVTRWKGPYLDASITATTEAPAVMTTGFAATISNGITRCDAAAATACNRTDGNFAALILRNMTVSEWETVNDLIDGESETATATGGKWRGTISSTVTLMDSVFYYAVPISN